jgi:peptide/nickel transport system permease protein
VLTFIIRRLLWTVLVMFVITLVVFVIFFKTPGVDPARAIAGRNPSAQVLQEIRAQFGLNRPLPIQYLEMMKSIFVTRDLVSYSNQGVKVVPEIVAAAPATLSLVFGAAVIWVVMAIAVGVAAALLRGTVFDPLLMVVALIGISAPVFWLGEVANLITQGTLHDTFLFSWVPPLGYNPFTQDPWLWFKGLIIPWITLSILYIGFYGRVLRANILETQNEDFIRTARAKGLSERRVLLRHTLRTSMIRWCSPFTGLVTSPGRRWAISTCRRSWPPWCTGRSSSCCATPSSTSPTPGSTRGYGRRDGRAATRGTRPQGLLPHRGRPGPGGRWRVAVAV